MMCAAHISAPARTSLHKEDPVKFFLDTADLDEIEEAASWGAIAGVTTNPSLYSRIGGKLSDFNNHIKRICDIVGPDCPVSAESVAMDREGIIRDGRELAAIAPNVVVKVPTMVEGLAATRVLANEGIPVNMTLCFTVPQAIMAARAGARYISPFVGRFDDISEDGVALVAHIVKVYRTYGYKTQVLAASIRHTQHIIQCLDAGADVATCPLAAIEGLLRHPLTDSGLEKFLADHARLNA